MSLLVGSYNITADFFTDNKDQTQHHWTNRKKQFENVVKMVNCDTLGLQELSPDQAYDICTMFANHGVIIFTQAKTDEVEAGKIYNTAKEVKDNLVGKFIGTALIGILYNKETG